MSVNISQLTLLDSPVGADQVAVYSSACGDTRRLSLTALSALILTGAISTDSKVTQYAAPSASPFTVLVLDSGASVWLVLTPTGTLATGTITLPTVANALDRQEVLVNCTQAVTTLTVGGNGATAVTGAPTSLAANDKFRMRYDAVTKTWYRVA